MRSPHPSRSGPCRAVAAQREGGCCSSALPWPRRRPPLHSGLRTPSSHRPIPSGISTAGRPTRCRYSALTQINKSNVKQLAARVVLSGARRSRPARLQPAHRRQRDVRDGRRRRPRRARRDDGQRVVDVDAAARPSAGLPTGRARTARTAASSSPRTTASAKSMRAPGSRS